MNARAYACVRTKSIYVCCVYVTEIKMGKTIAFICQSPKKIFKYNYIPYGSLFFFWKGSTFSDAVSDGTQPATCVDIQNRQSTYSCRCPMYGACQNDVFCGLFYSATLAIRCRSKTPFVHERLKTSNTSPQAVEPDP